MAEIIAKSSGFRVASFHPVPPCSQIRAHVQGKQDRAEVPQEGPAELRGSLQDEDAMVGVVKEPLCRFFHL